MRSELTYDFSRTIETPDPQYCSRRGCGFVGLGEALRSFEAPYDSLDESCQVSIPELPFVWLCSGLG